MIVRISEDIYLEKGYFELLDKIVDLFHVGKHVWDVQNPDLIKKSEWLKSEENSRLGKKVEFLTKATVRSAYIGKKSHNSKRILITSNPKVPEAEFDIQSAYYFLAEPLYIVVENENSDRVFIEAIARAFQLNDLLKAIDEGWIYFDSEGGGGAIPRKLHKHLQCPYKRRILVIVDSDKEHPHDQHGAEAIENLCIKNNIKCIILYKRAIENYIPLEAISTLPKCISHVVKAYLLLDDDQQDFYHLKKGFFGKGKLPEKQADLFNNISSRDQLFRDLRDGFSHRDYNPNDLYQLFDYASVNSGTLKTRCKRNPDELKNIMDAILSLL